MRYISFILLLSSLVGYGQVGINTNSPTATLEVNGDFKTDGSLFLENPGDNSDIRGSKLLIKTIANEVVQYNINTSKYGPINFAEFAFRNVSALGLQDYDTKISTIDYSLSVQGYSFLESANRGESAIPHSLLDDDNIEGHQFYAYANPITNTWFIRAFINNAEFQSKQGSSYTNTEVDIIMNVIIYRKGFITKEQGAIIVDMGNSETITAPLPLGF